MIAVVVITGISILGYVALSLLVNTPAPPLQSDAWAALVQPTSESQADTVTWQTTTEDAQIINSFTYTVSACGPHPYHAQLVISGLTGTSADYLTGGRQIPLQTQVSSFNVHYLAPEAIVDDDLSPVQAVNIDLPHVLPCTTSQGDADEIAVYGTLAAPWLESSSVFGGLWHGPHASLSLPYVGNIESGIGGAPVPFTLQGWPGTWTGPDHQQIRMAAYPPADWTVDSSMPALSNSSTPAWSASSSISPTAQLSDPSSIATLQDWIVVLAIIFGIGGGLLASLIFAYLRPSHEAHDSHSQAITAIPPHPPAPTPARQANLKPILTATAVLLAVGYIRRRRRER